MLGNITAGGEVIGNLAGGERRYFLKDHVGSVRTTVDRNGNVVGRDDYYPFGLTMPRRSSNSANPNDDYKFTGYELDDEAGLTVYHANARGYDPVLGRFNQIDPKYSLYPGWSTYQYGLNNPLLYTDPTGECIKQLPCPTLRDWGNGITKTYNQFKTEIGVRVEAAGDYLASKDFTTADGYMEVASDLSPIQSEGQSFGEVMDNVEANVATFISGDSDIKTAMIVSATVSLGVSMLTKGKKLSPNQMTQMIKKGNAPNGFTRVDVGKVKGEQTHIHFDNGSALNKDGTWKHTDGGTGITNKQRKWLEENDWTVPPKNE